MYNYKDKTWLYQKYWVEKLNMRAMAIICGCSYTPIQYWMKKHNIVTRPCYAHSRKYQYDEHIFNKCNDPEKAYWLGFIMADGCVTRGALCIHLSVRDRKHLEKFHKFIGSNHPLKVRPNSGWGKGNLGISLEIKNKALVNALKQYGIVPRKTGEEQIKNIPKEYISDFIRGYFDGDGCLTSRLKKNRKTRQWNFILVSASKKFLHHIQEILAQACDLSITKIIPTSSGTFHLAYEGNRQVPRILDYLKTNSKTCLERKYI